MSYYNDILIRDSLREWISLDGWSSPFAVTMTLKQRLVTYNGVGPSGVSLTPEIAQQNFRHFMNLLNREVFGHSAIRHGKRLRAVPVLEGGGYKRLHYHSVIDCPRDELREVFLPMIVKAWSSTQWGYHEVQVVPGADKGWVSYITKLRDKPDFSLSIDWMNFHNPN